MLQLLVHYNRWLLHPIVGVEGGRWLPLLVVANGVDQLVVLHHVLQELVDQHGVVCLVYLRVGPEQLTVDHVRLLHQNGIRLLKLVSF